SSSGEPGCHGGYPWRANHYYSAGAFIAPNGGMKGVDNLYGVFRAQTNGRSGAPEGYHASGGQPQWSGVRAGETVNDNGIVWVKIGPNTCRGDVFIANVSGPVPVASISSDLPTYPNVKLDSQHPLIVKLRNRGTLPLTVSKISIENDHGGKPADFTQ